MTIACIEKMLQYAYDLDKANEPFIIKVVICMCLSHRAPNQR